MDPARLGFHARHQHVGSVGDATSILGLFGIFVILLGALVAVHLALRHLEYKRRRHERRRRVAYRRALRGAMPFSGGLVMEHRGLGHGGLRPCPLLEGEKRKPSVRFVFADVDTPPSEIVYFV